MFAGLALMDARILEVAQNYVSGVLTSANPAYQGRVPRNTPPYTFNLWSTYRLTSAFKIGGGVEVKGERLAFSPNNVDPARVPTLNGSYHPNTAPGYMRWDAMASWEEGRWTARLNLKNVFNKLYYDAVYDNGGFTVPGPRRTVILTAEYRY